MKKIWFKSYPQGLPEEINPDEYRSLKEVLEDSCVRFRELPAYTSMGTTITYADGHVETETTPAKQSAGGESATQGRITAANLLV